MKVTCHDSVSFGQPIVEHMVRHSLGNTLKLLGKRSPVLIHRGSGHQATNTHKLHRGPNRIGGHASIKVQKRVERSSADPLMAWVTAKQQG